jgi:hypothetical protein
MAGPPPPEVADDKRAIMREVALTYRRETRAAQAARAKPSEQHHRAYEAAHAKYVELDPEAPSDRLVQSRIVTNMIANAIRTDSRWFWHGPDR